MTIFDFINMLGGLALFLFGMNEMGNGLETLSGSKLEKILSKLTSNPIKSVLFGALITAAIQSSSATTVIVVGLVNSGILKLRQAIGVIMGANIGTTITAQILSLSGLESSNIFLQFIKPTTLAPLFAIVGAVMLMFLKKKKLKNLGRILVGFGILFSGMFAMEAAVMPLRESPFFAQLFSTLSNPILGVLAGAFVTAVIQSSSASIGILQALSATGLISFSSAFPIIMGQNIGTTITPILASIGANKNAKRSAFVHVYFNILGTTIFLVIIYAYQAIIGFDFWHNTISSSSIANFHTLFNVTITLALLPFTGVLEKLATATVQDKGNEIIPEIPVLDERLLNTPSVAIPQAKNCLIQMAEYAKNNLHEATEVVLNYNSKKVASIHEFENAIDKMEAALDNYLVKITSREMSNYDSKSVSTMLQLVIEFERIGDYAISVVDRAEEIHDKKIVFSKSAQNELHVLNEALAEIVTLSTEAFKSSDIGIAKQVEPLEETIDIIKEQLRIRHINRLKSGKCSIDTGIVFLEVIAHLERIADHCSNIAFYVIALEKQIDAFDKHLYKQILHEGKKDRFNQQFEAYKQKYLSQIPQ